jgi:hypothetical protein
VWHLQLRAWNPLNLRIAFETVVASITNHTAAFKRPYLNDYWLNNPLTAVCVAKIKLFVSRWFMAAVSDTRVVLRHTLTLFLQHKSCKLLLEWARERRNIHAHLSYRLNLCVLWAFALRTPFSVWISTRFCCQRTYAHLWRRERSRETFSPSILLKTLAARDYSYKFPAWHQ